jgi:myosin heavy subunit
LEEVRDRRLGDYMTDFQAYCRRFISRRHLTRFARQTDAIKVMQRNARIYVTLREWPWWKMYAMLKPLSEFYETDALLKKQEKQIQEMKDQLEAQQQQINQLKDHNKHLEMEQDDFRTLLESEQATSRDLQDSKQSLLEEVAHTEERYEEVVAVLDETREQVDTLKHQLEISQQENAAQSAMISTLHQDIRDCSDDNDKMAAECEKWSDDYAILQKSEQTLKDEILQKDQHLASLEKEHEVSKRIYIYESVM